MSLSESQLLPIHNTTQRYSAVMKFTRIGFFISVFSALVSCNTLREVQAVTSVGNFVHPLTDVQPTLLARYHTLNESKDEKNGVLNLVPQYWGLKYSPRSVRYAGFENWDKLTLPQWWQASTRNDWLNLRLNRDAQIAVLVEKAESLPSWLGNDWQRSTLASGELVFKKSVKAGDVQLGAPVANKAPYEVLLSEANGQGTTAPSVPAGKTQALANQSCPSWLEELFVVAGPDGRNYKTWHPQIDPIYWCYYGHEHGSDPSLINYKPKFEYIALLNNDQAEIHNGFKGFVLKDEKNGYGWYVGVHAETGDIHRVCVRKHTVVVAVTDLRSGELLAELGYKGDFGASKTNQEINGVNKIIQPNMAGMTCDDQTSIATQTKNEKLIRVANETSISNSNYERWRGGISTGLGFSSPEWFAQGMEVDIRNPRTSCNMLDCMGTIANDSAGDDRTIFVPQLNLKYDQFKDASDGTNNDGVFYTDVYGNPSSKDNPKAVHQFVKPGLNVMIDGFFETTDAWRGMYVRDGRSTSLELEDSLKGN